MMQCSTLCTCVTHFQWLRRFCVLSITPPFSKQQLNLSPIGSGRRVGAIYWADQLPPLHVQDTVALGLGRTPSRQACSPALPGGRTGAYLPTVSSSSSRTPQPGRIPSQQPWWVPPLCLSDYGRTPGGSRPVVSHPLQDILRSAFWAPCPGAYLSPPTYRPRTDQSRALCPDAGAPWRSPAAALRRQSWV